MLKNSTSIKKQPRDTKTKCAPKQDAIEIPTVPSLEELASYTSDEARSRLFLVLLQHAMAGDVRAAKLYLDYALGNQQAESGLTLEQALQMMNAQGNQTEADDDEF